MVRAVRAVKQKLDKYAVCIMIFLGIAFYFFPGKWISIEDDSMTYLRGSGEGVLPGYPFFLRFFKTILGEQHFLDGVVIAQSILAIICTLLFVIMLRNRFKLHGWECILLYAACMLPFSIYLPESGITHQIMTEGITYSIFYLFFIVIMESVWTTKYRWYFISMSAAFILGIIRSQMLLLQPICLLVLLWITIRRIHGGIWYRISMCIAAFGAGLLLFFGSYKAIYTISALDIKHQAERELFRNEFENTFADIAESEDTVDRENSGNDYDSSSSVRSSTSQFVTIIMSKGFYEADREDIELFQDSMMREVFERTYELADAAGKLYTHATPGLYMWQDLVYDRMPGYAFQAIAEYDSLYPGERTRDTSSIVMELGMRVLLHHFGRYVYHAVRLMMPSFIATVFFQIKPIYLLCHFITLFLYIFAITGCAVVYRSRRDRKSVEFMAAVLGVLIIMVVSVNVLFIGLQRYVVYGMGIFYCALYLICKDILILIQQKNKK